MFGDGARGAFLGIEGPSRDLLKFAYDPGTGTYSIGTNHIFAEGENPTQTFGPADSVSGPEPTNFTYYEKATTDPRWAAGGPYTLAILKNAPDNSLITLSYLKYGLWSAPQGLWQTFLLGTETASNDVPLAGSATYAGIVDGYGLGHRITGTGSLTVHFATASLTTSLSLGSDGTLSGSGLIGAGTSHFDGTLSGQLSGVEAIGAFLGGFYGPGAAEAGYAFTAHNKDPLPDPDLVLAVEGVFVGKKP